MPSFEKMPTIEKMPKPESLGEPLKEVADREARRQQFYDAIHDLAYLGSEIESFSKMISTDKKLPEEEQAAIRDDFREKERELIAKLDKLKSFKISPAEKTDLAAAYLDYTNTNNLLFGYDRQTSYERAEIMERVISLLADGVIFFDKKDYQERQTLLWKGDGKSDQELQRFCRLTDQLRLSNSLIEEWATFSNLEYEPFDPRVEVKKIRSAELLPDEKVGDREDIQKARLEKFKETFLRQKEAMASLQLRLVDILRSDTDLSQVVETDPKDFHQRHEQLAQKLDDVVKNYARTFKFSPRQIKFYEDLVQDYFKKHLKVSELRRDYPNDRDLFKSVFDFEPSGKVEISQGPVNIYVRCFDFRDFAKVRQLGATEQPTIKDLLMASYSGGFNIYEFPKKQDLEGLINVENSSTTNQMSFFILRVIDLLKKNKLFNKIFDPSKKKYSPLEILNLINKLVKVSLGEKTPDGSKRIRIHEEQHAINKFFRGEEARIGDNPAHSNNDYLQKMRNIRKTNIDPRTKDEILAYYKDGVEDTFHQLTASRHYRYFDEMKEDIRSKYEPDKNSEKDADSQQPDPKEIQKLEQQVFVQEYQQLIKKSLEGITVLEKKSYSRDEIISLLLAERIGDWPKLAKRLRDKGQEF